MDPMTRKLLWWGFIGLVVLFVLTSVGAGNPLLGLILLIATVGFFVGMNYIEKRCGSNIALSLFLILAIALGVSRCMYPPSQENLDLESIRPPGRF